jgi:hypothetical protein
MAASVVVLIVHARDVAALEGEGHPPVAAHGDGPDPSPVATQFVQVEPRQAHVVR